MKTWLRGSVDSGSRVLVVDDDRDSLTLLRLLLSGVGFEVLTADGVAEALEILRRQAPALVITDFVMPGQSGLDLCRYLRADSRTHAIPVVLHTATEPTSAEASWFDAVFIKPANMHTLLATAQAFIARGAHVPGGDGAAGRGHAASGEKSARGTSMPGHRVEGAPPPPVERISPAAAKLFGGVHGQRSRAPG